MSHLNLKSGRVGFSLIEVVLAIGIFLVTVLALVGLLGPTLRSVDEVEKMDEIQSVVNTVNAFLQHSQDIATATVSKFDAVYNAVDSADHATLFVFRRYTSASGTDVELVVGFLGETNAALEPGDFANAAGPVFRVVLTASSVTPPDHLDTTVRNANGIFTLSSSLTAYDEGYLALEVRIFDLDEDTTDAAGSSGGLPDVSDLSELNRIEPLFTYNTAIVR
ncbi:MAG: type IV pilus modification PilV family protein [Opitutales bacterium]